MANKYAQLEILPINKTVVFYSPVEGSDVLVRTGTIPDGSCFYHSLLHAYSRDYVNMNENGRMKFVRRLRASMAGKIDKDKWESMSNGLISRLGFQEHVHKLFIDFYQFIERKDTKGKTRILRKVLRNIELDNNDEDLLEAYRIIVDMLPFTECFEKNILPQTYSKTEDKLLFECTELMVRIGEEYYEKIFLNIDEKLDQKRINFFIDKLSKLIKSVCKESDNIAYKEYIESVQNSALDVDGYTIDLISTKFNRDIYFIDAKNRLPYRNGSTTHNIKHRKSMIVMWTGGVHYEIVGRLLPGNRVAREFDPEDPLIKRIRTYLLHPEKIPLTYPNLIPYLPKEIRDQIGIDMSTQEVSQNIDKDYEMSDNEDDDEVDSSDIEESD